MTLPSVESPLLLPKSPVLFPKPAPAVEPLPARDSSAPLYADVFLCRSKRNSSLEVGAEESSDLLPVVG